METQVWKIWGRLLLVIIGKEKRELAEVIRKKRRAFMTEFREIDAT